MCVRADYHALHYDMPSSVSFQRRPHLVFGDGSQPFKITGVTSGVQYGEGSPIAEAGQDACYTLYQPVQV